MATVRLNTAAIRAYGSGPAVEQVLKKWGQQVAEDARRDAPKDTGAGAASIGYEFGEDSDGAFVKVSWDADHFYLAFAELGTSTQSARPFLRPAASKRRVL